MKISGPRPLRLSDPARAERPPCTAFEARERVVSTPLSPTARRAASELIRAVLERGTLGFNSAAAAMAADGPGGLALIELHNKKLLRIGPSRVDFLP